jgi:hypothetical protein
MQPARRRPRALLVLCCNEVVLCCNEVVQCCNTPCSRRRGDRARCRGAVIARGGGPPRGADAADARAGAAHASKPTRHGMSCSAALLRAPADGAGRDARCERCASLTPTLLRAGARMRSTRARVPEQAQAQKRRCTRMHAHTEQRMRMHGLGGQTRSARVASTHADGTTATVVRRAGVGVRAPRRRSLARRKSAAHTDVQGTPAITAAQHGPMHATSHAACTAQAAGECAIYLERGGNIKP